MTIDDPAVLMASPNQNRRVCSSQLHCQQSAAEMKARQSAKIRELKDALVLSRIFALDEQAEVLGLNRSTTWTILKGNHKTSGLSATVINRILAAPQLPPLVRAKIVEYVNEKAAGHYGHGEMQRRKFIALLSTQVGRTNPS
jgi:hypothetical protein